MTIKERNQMLNELKEHLKFISKEIQRAQSSIDHYALDDGPENVPFAKHAQRLDALHNHYGNLIVDINRGEITDPEQVLARIRQIEVSYPTDY
jgi:ribose 5-phosphate isomerase